jgi:predicted acylesterase/phospholipase RssA
MAGTQPARVPASRVLLVAAFGAFLAFLDATIVNVAFPSIRASFSGTSIGGLCAPPVAPRWRSGGGGGRSRTGRPRSPALGETLLRTMMIGSGGAVSAARAQGAWVVTPPTLGVGLLEFHQLDRMIQAGRTAARALLEEAGGDLAGNPREETELELSGPAAEPVPAR